jgi:hypothetical protein
MDMRTEQKVGTGERGWGLETLAVAVDPLPSRKE